MNASCYLSDARTDSELVLAGNMNTLSWSMTRPLYFLNALAIIAPAGLRPKDDGLLACFHRPRMACLSGVQSCVEARTTSASARVDVAKQAAQHVKSR